VIPAFGADILSLGESPESFHLKNDNTHGLIRERFEFWPSSNSTFFKLREEEYEDMFLHTN
jgi:hypothetical protein